MLIVPNVYYDKFDDVLLHWYNDGEQMWYKFYDVAKAFDYNDSLMNATWKKQIDENDKTEFEEEWEDFKGNICINKYQYINTVALFKLCDRYERVIGKIRKHVGIIESTNEYVNTIDDNNQRLKVNLGMMEQCLNDENYEKLASISKLVLDSKMIQQIRYGNPAKEELINHFRDDVYDCEDEFEVEWNIKMYKKNNPEEEEERKAKFKRNKGIESTCPSWLRDVVK